MLSTVHVAGNTTRHPWAIPSAPPARLPII
jgi:hypothetical protein